MSRKKSKGLNKALSALRASCATVAEYAFEYANKDDTADPKLYAALTATEAPPKNAILASAIEPRINGAGVVARGVHKRINEDHNTRVYAVLVTPESHQAPAGRPNLDLLPLRKVKNDLKKLSIDHAVGVTKVLQRPSKCKPGFENYLALDLLLYGPNLDDGKMQLLQRAVDKRFGGSPGATVMSYESIDNDLRAITDAAASMFDLADRKAISLEAVKEAEALNVKGWAKKRPLREFLRLQTLASVSLKCLLIGKGDGERLADRVMVDGKHALKPMWKTIDQIIHRDQVPQFLAAELVRRKLSRVQLPFVKTR